MDDISVIILSSLIMDGKSPDAFAYNIFSASCASFRSLENGTLKLILLLASSSASSGSW